MAEFIYIIDDETSPESALGINPDIDADPEETEWRMANADWKLNAEERLAEPLPAEYNGEMTVPEDDRCLPPVVDLNDRADIEPLFDLAKWERICDCHHLVYHASIGCMQSA